MTDTSNTRVKESGLRSDGELVQAQGHFDFRAGAADAAGDAKHESWVDLLSMGQTAARTETAPESLSIAHETITHEAGPADELF